MAVTGLGRLVGSAHRSGRAVQMWALKFQIEVLANGRTIGLYFRLYLPESLSP